MSIAYTKSANEAFHQNRNYSYFDAVKSALGSTEQKVMLVILILSALIWLPVPFVSPCLFSVQPGFKFLFPFMTILTPILATTWGVDASKSYVQQHMFCKKP